MMQIGRASIQAAIVVAWVVAGSVPALAHAELLLVVQVPHTADAPTGDELQFSFSEGIELAFSKVTILDGSGKEVAPAELTLDPADNRIVSRPFRLS